jgi:hypothetical protein
MLKRPLEPNCNHIIMNACIHHISSQRYATTILESSFHYVFSFTISAFHYLIEIEYYCIFVFLSEFFVSFHSLINLDQWYQSSLPFIYFSVHVPNEVRV